jgi:hypothetical protein
VVGFLDRIRESAVLVLFRADKKSLVSLLKPGSFLFYKKRRNKIPILRY